jgi:hypothetical protein
MRFGYAADDQITPKAARFPFFDGENRFTGHEKQNLLSLICIVEK